MQLLGGHGCAKLRNTAHLPKMVLCGLKGRGARERGGGGTREGVRGAQAACMLLCDRKRMHAQRSSAGHHLVLLSSSHLQGGPRGAHAQVQTVRQGRAGWLGRRPG